MRNPTAPPSPEGAIAHVLRRLGFGPAPFQAEELAASTDARSLAAAMVDGAADRRDDDEPDLGDGDAEGALMTWWLRRMVDATDDPHERMVWYWHGHLTSSLSKATAQSMWEQHLVLRDHALGNFRELLQAMTVDGAMLWFLDGAWATAGTPNENFARELFELFALGRGAYGEDDVRAAARVFTGWGVDWESNEVTWHPDNAYRRPVTVFGVRRRWTAEELVDAVCDHEACAPHVTRRLYRHLVGTEPEEGRLVELAEGFRSSGLEIRPLVRAIVTGDDFHAAVRNRPRCPVEWFVAALRTLGHGPDDPLDPWWTMQLGQVPFRPPNVAGWPDDERWLGANQVLLRASTAFAALPDGVLPDHVVDRVEPTVASVLAHCGVHDASEVTLATLRRALDDQGEYAQGLDLLILLTLLSPEFSLA